MSYLRFAAMIAVSTLLMYGLMYLNTYAAEHVWFSQTRLWMTLIMGGSMAVVMMAFMRAMYHNHILNAAIMICGAAVVAGSLWLVRSQETVDDIAFMKAMIPHHSIAIMTSERAHIRDPRVRVLADDILNTQVREIAEMERLIGDLKHNPPAADAPDLPAPRRGVGG